MFSGFPLKKKLFTFDFKAPKNPKTEIGNLLFFTFYLEVKIAG